jgi:2-hydroxy-3-keto-5-methylthiopentenyl-1-phosphate phosphatase
MTTRWSVCCDFDGTVCLPDSCDYLLSRFAAPEWKTLDADVWAGRLTEREAFPRQMALLRVTWDEACAALAEGVRIREGFPAFVEFCRKREVPLTILSSGLEELIRELLRREGVTDIAIEAHHVAIDHDGWRVILRDGPRLAEHCSHCKCVSVEAERAAGRKVVYIGDGYTDLCPVERADVVFATGKLARACAENGREFAPFETFYDVERKLGELFS